MWSARLRSGDASADDWAIARVWLESSPAHLTAFEAVEAISDELDGLASDLKVAVAPRSADILPFRPRPAPTPRRPAWGAIAAGAAGLAMVLGFGAWRASQGELVTYRTLPGEVRSVTLADGSHVEMDAASTLSVRQGWFSRQARLDDGEATFDVTKNPSRPFVIRVSDQRVRVVGTQFNIRNYDRLIDVTVRRGVVDVYSQGGGPAPVARLTPGWSLEHRVGDAQSVTRQVDPDNAFAWTRGRLICDQLKVSEIVAYLNRRYKIPVSVSPAAGERKFSGVLELGDENDVLRHIAAYETLNLHRTEQNFSLN